MFNPNDQDDQSLALADKKLPENPDRRPIPFAWKAYYAPEYIPSIYLLGM
jgi:hypothetical protein